MKKILFVLIFLPIHLFSQNKSGTITYVVLDVKKATTVDSIVVNKKSIELAKTLKFNLDFNAVQSKFYVVEPINSSTSISFAKNASTVNGFYINNIKEKKVTRYCEFEELGGKLAIENTNVVKWQLTSEKKIISGYECYLAKGTFNDYNRYVREYNLEAWYCPKIPLSIGPKYYSGLPGLIMEITDNKVTFGVEKIDFGKKIELEKLNKNKYKSITDVQYQKMITASIEELMKQKF